MRIPPLTLVSVVTAAGLLSAQERPAPVDFSRQIQPLLQQHCVKCHGSKEAEGDLRLDLRSHVFGPDPDLWTIVPGDPEFSVVLERIMLPADDPDVMPAEGEHLTDAEIALIRTWIEEGANWPESADAELLALEAKRRAREVIELPPLEEAARIAVDQALEALRERGAVAMRIAANTDAVEVNFSLLGDRVDGESLGALAGLEPVLVWLNASRTAVDDGALEALTPHRNLRRLNLANTKVGDAGLPALAALEQLEYLNLYGTAVSDAGLASLAGLVNLRQLYLWQTAVTDAGAAALAAKIPGLRIDLGRAAEAMLEAAKPRAKEPIPPRNTSCPVSGKPIDPAVTSDFAGGRVAFCCTDCKAKFDADPEAYRERLEH